MNSTDFNLLLVRLRACLEARRWAKGKSLAEVWQLCERGDWLLWLCGRMAGESGWPTRQEVDAAYATAYASAVRTKTLKECADMVRSLLKVPIEQAVSA